MGVLRIPEIPQYGVIIEEKYDKEQSLFHEVYQGAIKNVYDIISRQKNPENELFLNPCIAFVGKRGTGKSSAMSSFANFLHKNKIMDHSWINNKSIETLVSDTNFYRLPAIDTANMGEKETIIADVSAEMYSEYKKISKNISVEQKRSFIEATKKANDTAILKSTGEWIRQGDQLLTETNKVVHIKKLFEGMVNNFLAIVLKDVPPQNRYLIIQIDDLDMNVTNSFSIMEEIRNILSIKNVIVLLSVDVEQLKTVSRIHFENPLCTLTKDEKNNISKDLAYKYIEKLLPVDRRHYMPELTQEQLNDISSGNFLGDQDKYWDKWSLDLNGKATPSVLHSVMHLIWRKTLLIPTQNEFGEYAIIPHNLRSLCNFIVFLRNMKDVAYPSCNPDIETPVPLTYFDFADIDKGEQYRNNLDYNLRTFKKYLISNIETHKKPEMNKIENYISELLLKLIDTLSEVNIEEMNNKIVGDLIYGLNTIETRQYYELINKNKTLDSILCSIHHSFRVSMGDVIYILKEIEKNAHCIYIKYLVEIIRTLWSIRMTQELFVNGCNEKNKNFWEANTKYITKSFRDSVGSIILNPDVEKLLSCNRNDVCFDWSICDKKKKPEIYDIVIPNEEHCLREVNKPYIYEIKNWRVNLRTGRKHYRGYIEDGDHFWLSHPIATFSNLLSPGLIEEKNQNLNHLFSDWQGDYILSLPFYSMGYIEQFLFELLKSVNRAPFPKIDSLMKYIFEKATKICDKLWKNLNYYIPNLSVSQINSYSKQIYLEEIQNKNFIFQAPIESLYKIMNWEKKLLSTNVYIIEKLDESLNVLTYNKADNIEGDINQYFYTTYKTLCNYFPSQLLTEFFSEEKIKQDELTSFLKALKNENEDSVFSPFYYYEQIENFGELKVKDSQNTKKENDNGN